MKNLVRLFILLIVVLVAAPVAAQGPGGTKVTDDDVNRVARKLYCPVCENIPLDTCGTAACAQWRDEIRIQLESGKSEEQIVTDFVTRYGDRVVGTPQDPTLRALSLITPWVISAAALALAVVIFIRWRRDLKTPEPAVDLTSTSSNTSIDEYRARLERDLARRR